MRCENVLNIADGINQMTHGGKGIPAAVNRRLTGCQMLLEALDMSESRTDHQTFSTHQPVMLFFSPLHRRGKMRPRGASPGSAEKKRFEPRQLGSQATHMVITAAVQEARG